MSVLRHKDPIQNQFYIANEIQNAVRLEQKETKNQLFRKLSQEAANRFFISSFKSNSCYDFLIEVAGHAKRFKNSLKLRI